MSIPKDLSAGLDRAGKLGLAAWTALTFSLPALSCRPGNEAADRGSESGARTPGMPNGYAELYAKVRSGAMPLRLDLSNTQLSRAVSDDAVIAKVADRQLPTLTLEEADQILADAVEQGIVSESTYRGKSELERTAYAHTIGIIVLDQEKLDFLRAAMVEFRREWPLVQGSYALNSEQQVEWSKLASNQLVSLPRLAFDDRNSGDTSAYEDLASQTLRLSLWAKGGVKPSRYLDLDRSEVAAALDRMYSGSLQDALLTTLLLEAAVSSTVGNAEFAADHQKRQISDLFVRASNASMTVQSSY